MFKKLAVGAGVIALVSVSFLNHDGKTNADLESYLNKNKIGDTADYGVFKEILGPDLKELVVVVSGLKDARRECDKIATMLNDGQGDTATIWSPYVCYELNH